MNAPIRVRLTAWYVLVLAAVLIALGAFVATRLRSDLTNEVDGQLRAGAIQIAAGYKAEGAKEFHDVAQTVLPGSRSEGSGAQIVDANGRFKASYGTAGASPPLAGAELRRVIGGDTLRRSFDDTGSPPQHLRLLAIPAERDGRRQALVVVESLASVDRAVNRVQILLLLGGGAALAFVALGGWWIARKALKPVERMTTRADSIGIDDLSERIAVPRVNDEVGHLARTLNAMLDRLQSGVEARQRLVADASHELRGPLAAMRSEIEVSLRHDELDQQARAVLASARDEVIRMGRIVDDLLTLARVDEGRLDLLLVENDLSALAGEAVRTRQAAAEASGVGVLVDGDPVDVRADRDRVEQVIGNLVDNAIRFAPRGTEVRVSVLRDAGEARISVSDSGPGVPPEARQRIFERFAREDPARSRSGGAGLGLAICKEIVRAHGGRIWVEEREPRGSTFVVALPLGRGGAAEAAPRGARDLALSGGRPS